MITKRGEDAVVVLSRAEYDRLTRPRAGLADFLEDSPLARSGLRTERDGDVGR